MTAVFVMGCSSKRKIDGVQPTRHIAPRGACNAAFSFCRVGAASVEVWRRRLSAARADAGVDEDVAAPLMTSEIKLAGDGEAGTLVLHAQVTVRRIARWVDVAALRRKRMGDFNHALGAFPWAELGVRSVEGVRVGGEDVL
jgi:hypothetical protein